MLSHSSTAAKVHKGNSSSEKASARCAPTASMPVQRCTGACCTAGRSRAGDSCARALANCSRYAWRRLRFAACSSAVPGTRCQHVVARRPHVQRRDQGGVDGRLGALPQGQSIRQPRWSGHQ